MCGIAGLMTANGARFPGEVLDALASALRHRGPDGEGRHLGDGVGLIHRRLAIIDLETGAQPMTDAEGAQLVANAEIYNYRELRAAFPDTPFATQSDCEVVLPLYRRDGVDFARSLRGMYALALVDRERLLLARDPFGIKPLYYAETAKGFAFASEPQALIEAGLVAARVNARAREELLELQFTTGAETLFEGIFRVLPGETLVVSRGRITERRHLPALPSGERERRPGAETLEDLDRVLAESVGFHQRSDVPYGMFLSGGIDSSALLAVMARLNERPVRAFTAGFPGTSADDERARARHVARALGAEHIEIEVDETDFWTLLPEIAAALDDPVADYAALPTYKLAREAGRELKVVLCGEGGDELFAGYGRYRRAMRPPWLGGRPMRRRGFLEGLGVLRRETRAWREGIERAERAASMPGRSRLQVAQALDCADWLPHDLLIKVDRCLMAHGVEGRTPYLDPAIARFAYPLPDRLKVRRGLGKWLLRRWLARTLPEAEAFSRKRGFTVPVAEWLTRRGDELAPLIARSPALAEICRPEAVEALFRKPAVRAGLPAWSLLFYALWHRRHVEGRRSGGDVFEVLSESA
ncbi:MAG: asparagine synthase (glutamine-hydrolyzing) [Proteobacteria bacterium]|nr:asparagine synthase (glutamine-hydrolyzing) [Pseudomonadota bacterium]